MARPIPRTRTQRSAPPHPDTAILREHGRHLPAAQPDAVEIVWRQIHGVPGRSRLHDQTCTCRTPLYEYVSAGGVYFVRRIDHSAAPPTVAESFPRLRESEALALWTALLTGQAR